MIRRSIPVFCYHDVGPHGGLTLARFQEHLDAIEALGFATLSGRELLDVFAGRAGLRGRQMALTFDDGHVSALSVIAPELARRNMTGIFFAVTDFIAPGAVRKPSRLPEPKPAPDYFRDAILDEDYSQFINEGEIAALIEQGHEVWGHSARHQGCFRTPDPRPPLGNPKARWPAVAIYPPGARERTPDAATFAEGSAYVYNGFWPVPDAAAIGGWRFIRRTDEERRALCRGDFARCMERIKALNKSEIQLFCWPWGQFDALAEEELKRAGFAGAFTLDRGPNTPGSNPFRIHRVGVGRTKTGSWVRQRLRMYCTAPGASVFFKRFTKKPELASVLLATDSDKISGGGRQLLNNARALMETGLAVHGLFAPGAPLGPELESMGGTVHLSHAFRRPLALGLHIKDLCRKHGLDVVHTFHNRAYKGGAVARLLGMRARLFINRGVVFAPNLLFGLWARLAHGVVVNSLACAATLRRLGAPASRLNLVYNSFVAEPPLPERPDRDKRGVRVLTVLNEGRAKGFDVFLAAAARLAEQGRDRDVEYVAVGLKKPEPFLTDLDPRVLDRLSLPGPLPHDRVIEELMAADVLVIPSRQESLPNVLLEGFAASLPVVVTRAGGMPELVAHGVNGLVVPVEDPDALAEALRALIKDPLLRRRMGRAGRTLVTRQLDNRSKGLRLLAVYHGHRGSRPLDIEQLAHGPEPEHEP